MTKVFVGGSRRVVRLNEHVRRRLDNIVDKRHEVLVGDANGADKAVQKYLMSKHYDNVEVFCSGVTCRNNAGGWRTRNVPVRSRVRNASFYSAKDRVMADEAAVGLMIWDGESVGTLLNVLRLCQRGKIAVMFSLPDRRFFEFRHSEDWSKFIAQCRREVRMKVEKRAADEDPPPSPLFARPAAE